MKDTKIPEKTRIIETNKRNTKPAILIRPKQVETVKDTRMRITRTIQIDDQINFQMIQTKTALILQMASTQHKEKLLNHPNMKNNFDISNRRENMIIYGIPTEMKEYFFLAFIYRQLTIFFHFLPKQFRLQFNLHSMTINKREPSPSIL